MKKIAFLILTIAFLIQGNGSLFAQANTQKIGSPNVTSIILGGLKLDSAFKPPFLPKAYSYTKGQTTFGQIILATEDTALWLNKGGVQVQIFDQSDTNTTYGPTTPYYVNKEINKVINDSTINVKVVGYGLDRIDSILLVDSTKILTVNKAAQTYVDYIDTTGTIIIPSQYQLDTAKKAIRAASVKYPDTLNSVTIPSSYQVDTAKANIRRTITNSSVGAVTSASNYEFLYKDGDTLRGASNVMVDSPDKRLILAQNDTTQPASSVLGLKIYRDKYIGYNNIGLIDTVGVYTNTQINLGHVNYGSAVPGTASQMNYTGTFAGGNATTLATTATTVVAAYNAGIPLSNYTRFLVKSSASPNNAAIFRSAGGANGGLGALIGGTNLIGGGKLVIRFGVPDYNVGHRYMVGWSPQLGTNLANSDPSSYSNIILLGKDGADTTWKIMHNNNVGTAQKIETGLTPNPNYVYRLSIYCPPSGTIIYLVLDVISSTTTISTYRYTITSDLPTNVRIYPTLGTNTVATSISASIAIINVTEELH